MKELHQRTCDTCGTLVWANEEFGDYTSYDSYYTVWAFFASEESDEPIEAYPQCGATLEEDSTIAKEE